MVKIFSLLIMPLIFVVCICSQALCAIDPPWETTFNCTESSQYSVPLCDGMSWGGAWYFGDYRTQITSTANNPSGSGGNGARFWVGDGTNVNTGTISNYFTSPQKELWIRWYMRYQNGFKWSSLSYDKMLYINTGSSGVSVIPEWYQDKYVVISQGSPNYYQVQSTSSGGWKSIMGSDISDGKWHAFEIYIKMDTNQTNGIGRLWIDGVLHASNESVNWSGGNATAQQGWVNYQFHSNQATPGNGQAMAVDYDDMAVYNSTPPNVDAFGNPFIGLLGDAAIVPPPSPEPILPQVPDSEFLGEYLFQENFEDSDFSNRGWYDNVSPVLNSVETVPASAKSLEFNFPVGATRPISGGAMRKKFVETDSVYLSYFVKYSSNWQGSNKPYHPHEFHFLTNKDGDWSGLASTHLTAYIEQNEGTPVLAIQDALNIDQTRINQDLTNITEQRGVAGCNGDSDGYGNGSCYSTGTSYVNGKNWKAGSVFFSDNAGPYYKNDWHKIETFIQLNSIVNGKAVADGVLQYWYDGELVLDYHDVVLRTGENPDMKFNQFVIAPWIGDGSPVDQTFWVDDLVVATSRVSGENTTLLPASRLRPVTDQ